MAGNTPEESGELARIISELRALAMAPAASDEVGRFLQEWREMQTGINRAYCAALSRLLAAANGQLSSEAITQEDSKLSQMRHQVLSDLGKTFSSTEDETKAETRSAEIGGSGEEAPADPPVEHAVAELVSRLEKVMESTGEARIKEEATQCETSHDLDNNGLVEKSPPKHDVRSMSLAESDRPTPQKRSDENGNLVNRNVSQPPQAEKMQPAAERRVNSAYRFHLDRKHDEIERLQNLLSQKTTEAILQNKEFGALLEVELSALQQAEDIQEIGQLKQILIGGTQELIQGQRSLADKLRGSLDYLKLVKSDSERLRDELDKVRLLSLTDEFTGLPNRRAFMRRLEDEIGRAQRYGTPLALALIDLDEFKLINDKYGHTAGDEALNWYSQNALTIFRHHDMVARYGGEEFAVLLPNTNLEGALCALNKVRRKTGNAKWQFGNEIISVPTFSTGLTLYAPGEPPSSVIDRADRALYRAKRLGKNRIETELPKGKASEGTTVPDAESRHS